MTARKKCNIGRFVTDVADFTGKGIELDPTKIKPYDLKKDFVPVGTVVYLRSLEEPVTVDAILPVHDGRIFDHGGSIRQGDQENKVYFNVEDIVFREEKR